MYNCLLLYYAIRRPQISFERNKQKILIYEYIYMGFQKAILTFGLFESTTKGAQSHSVSKAYGTFSSLSLKTN